MTTEDLRDLVKQAENPEPLDPELQRWATETEDLGLCIQHPLMYSIMHHPALNAVINKGFRQKKAMHDEMIEGRNWFGLVFVVYERAYRLEAFRVIEEHLTNEEWWDLLGSIWTDSENIHQEEEDWLMYLSSDRPCREAMMDEDERAVLADLPDEFVIYRGFSWDDREEGCSWSLDEDRAAWFAGRLCTGRNGEVPRLATGVVKKENVIAYFACRGEDEIVVLPEHVRIDKIAEVEYGS